MKMKPTTSIISAIALTMPLVSTNIANAQTATVTVPTPTVYYSFDDLTASETLAANTGTTVITDSSGNNYNGEVRQRAVNVTADGLSGNGLTNLTTGWYRNTISSSSQVRVNMAAYAPLTSGAYSRNIPVTISMWAKNPATTPTSNTWDGATYEQDRFILLGVAIGDAENTNNAWEVWLGKLDPETGLRTINITMQAWNGGCQTYTSEAFEWDSSVWYNVVLQYSKATATGYAMNYSIYLTKQTGEFGEPILSGTTTNIDIVTANLVYFGGQNRTWNEGGTSGGSLGAGAIIDECAIWATAEGALLTQEQLAANFAKFATVPVPEPAATVAFVGFLALVTVSLFRHRR
jgi:hypothetical protein